MKIRKPIQQGTALVPCRIKGQNSLKKIGSIAGKVLLALLLILLLLAVFGTAPTLPDWWMIRWTLPTNTANILWTTTSLIFMWTADGTGSRGTGWTVSENR